MALLFHSNLNRTIVTDYGWAFTQYLETVAILGQFVLFTRKVRNENNIGRRNRNIHITLRSLTGYLTYIKFDFLDFHIYSIE